MYLLMQLGPFKYPFVIHSMPYCFSSEHLLLHDLRVFRELLRHIRRQLVLFLEHLQLTVRAHVLESQADARFSQDRLQQVPLMRDVLGEQAVGLEGPRR